MEGWPLQMGAVQAGIISQTPCSIPPTRETFVPESPLPDGAFTGNCTQATTPEPEPQLMCLRNVFWAPCRDRWPWPTSTATARPSWWPPTRVAMWPPSLPTAPSSGSATSRVSSHRLRQSCTSHDRPCSGALCEPYLSRQAVKCRCFGKYRASGHAEGVQCNQSAKGKFRHALKWLMETFQACRRRCWGT